MRKLTTFWRALTLAGTCGLLWGVGGGCLPEDLLAGTVGEIVNGLIISGFNAALGGTGLQI